MSHQHITPLLDQCTLQPFIDCCIGRHDDYAIQTASGRYHRAGSPLTYDVIRQHLQGSITIGTYVINERGLCRFVVYDSDTPDGLAQLAHVQHQLAGVGVASHLELTRRGAHLRVFFVHPILPVLARQWLAPYCPADVEFYPKQDTASFDHPGSLMRVPLGIHRLTGARYPFVTWTHDTCVSVASGITGMLAWFAGASRVQPPPTQTEYPIIPTNPTNQQNMSFKKATQSTTFSPSLSIREWCRQQDALSVISRYVELDASGLGCCPFGSHHADGIDAHPSFVVYTPVYPDVCCWFCRTWNAGGSLFDFLKYYYGLDNKTLWSRILSGGQF